MFFRKPMPTSWDKWSYSSMNWDEWPSFGTNSGWAPWPNFKKRSVGQWTRPTPSIDSSASFSLDGWMRWKMNFIVWTRWHIWVKRRKNFSSKRNKMFYSNRWVTIVDTFVHQWRSRSVHHGAWSGQSNHPFLCWNTAWTSLSKRLQQTDRCRHRTVEGTDQPRQSSFLLATTKTGKSTRWKLSLSDRLLDLAVFDVAPNGQTLRNDPCHESDQS